MNIYFDTEFTQLSKNGELISIGLVTDNHETFYAEFSDFSTDLLTEWHYDNVMKNLLLWPSSSCRVIEEIDDCVGMIGNKHEVMVKLLVWLARFDEEIQLVSDVCHYDFMFFIDLFGTAFDLPKFINPVCIDINQEIARYLNISNKEAFDVNRESLIDVEIMGKHNALHDAFVIREVYKKINCNLK